MVAQSRSSHTPPAPAPVPHPGKELEQHLFASMDLDFAGGVPLVTDDIDTLKRRDAAAPYALAVLPKLQNVSVEVVAPKRPSTLKRISTTVDLFLDRIEPILTGDFLRSSDLPPARTSEPPAKGSKGEELVTVDRILGGVDIVMDMNDLLADASRSTGTLASIDVPPASWSADVPVEAVPLDQLPLAASSTPTAEEDAGPRDVLASSLRDPASSLSPAGPSPDVSLSVDEAEESFFAASALVAARRYDEAAPMLARLVRHYPNRTDYHAAASWVRFALADSEKKRAVEVAELERYAEAFPFCAETQLVLGRMFLAIERPAGAVRYLRRAHELAPERPELLAELRAANEVVEDQRRARQASFDPDSGEVVARVPSRTERLLTRTDLKRTPPMLVLGALVVAALFVSSIVLELGRFEQWLDPTDGFFWARSVALLTSGLLGARVFLRHRPLGREDWAVAPGAITAALILGALIGAVLPVHVVRYPALTVAVMLLFQVVAEEVFFRRMLGCALGRVLVGLYTPALISGVLYAIYQLTRWGQWTTLGTPAGLSELGLSLAAGTGYALVHLKTRSLGAALACHLTAALVVALAAAR